METVGKLEKQRPSLSAASIGSKAS